MRLNLFEEVKELTKNLVKIPSINKMPGGETALEVYWLPLSVCTIAPLIYHSLL